MNKTEALKREVASKGGLRLSPGVIKKPYILLLNLADLNVASYAKRADGYQRELREATIKAIIKDPCIDRMGFLIVALRPDGSYWLLDGQQRKTALDILGEKKFECQVIPVDGKPKTEADLYSHLNGDRMALRPFEFYKADVVGEHEDAIAVHKAAKKAKIEIDKTTCVKCMRDLAKLDQPIFEKALDLTAKICKGNKPHKDILRGVFTLERLLQKTKPDISIFSQEDSDTLVNRGMEDVARTIQEVRLGTGSTNNSNSKTAPANGIVNMLNQATHRRHWRRKLPSISPGGHFLVEA